MTTNIIASLILIAILGGAIYYIIKSKKNGQKCIGCPHAKQCGDKCNCASKQKQEKQ